MPVEIAQQIRDVLAPNAACDLSVMGFINKHWRKTQRAGTFLVYLRPERNSKAAENIYVEADGELLGRLPITLSVVPDAFTVLVPKGHPTLQA